MTASEAPLAGVRLTAGLAVDARDRREYQRQYYQKNRERLIAKARAWELAHQEEAAQKKREYLQRHPEKRKETSRKYAAKPEVKAAKVAKRKESAELRAREKALRKHYRDTLADCFVRRVLAQRTGMKGSEIPQTLVDVHRELMRLKRAINEKL
jgi:hypothetical protein